MTTEKPEPKAEPKTRAMSIRGIDKDVYQLLRVRAATNGKSMEAEVRDILSDAVAEPSDMKPGNLGTLMHSYVTEVGGAEFELPARDELATGVDYSEW